MPENRSRSRSTALSILVGIFFTIALLAMLGMLYLLFSQPAAANPSPAPAQQPSPDEPAGPAPTALPVREPTQTPVPNLAPEARILASILSGTAPLRVDLDASASLDPEGSPLQFRWDCGRGMIQEGRSVGCDFPNPGSFLVQLSAVDERGALGQASITVQVNEPAFQAKYVILFIGDGMGFEQVRAGGMYLNGQEGTLSFEGFPYRAEMTTYSLGGVDTDLEQPDSSGTDLQGVTDSAAAATALASGEKVRNGVLSLAIPGDGRELYTLLEYARDQGLSTGLVTTTTLTHATPAAFGAHAADRTLYDEIASDLLHQTRPNLLFGGGGAGMTAGGAMQAGYQVVVDMSGFINLQPETFAPGQTFISGQFGVDFLPYEADGPSMYPRLDMMTQKALQILDNDPDGFFLMVEGGRIDHAAHENDPLRTAAEVAGLSNAVAEALEWAQSRPDVLIVVLADHETGGLQVRGSNGPGSAPGAGWSTTSHTGSNVPVYLYGSFSDDLPVLIDNADIPDLISAGKFPGN